MRTTTKQVVMSAGEVRIALLSWGGQVAAKMISQIVKTEFQPRKQHPESSPKPQTLCAVERQPLPLIPKAILQYAAEVCSLAQHGVTNRFVLNARPFTRIEQGVSANNSMLPFHTGAPQAARSRRASCISFCWMVTRFAWMAQRFASWKRLTRKASVASCRAMMA